MELLATPVIRRIRPDDWPMLRALRLEMLADTPIAYGESLAQAEAKPAEFWSSRAAARAEGTEETTFLAVADGALVGVANGRAELGLEVARQNPRAVASYERLGFVRTGASEPHPLFPDVIEEEMIRPARWP